MFIAKNNDLIILANNSREVLEQQLQFMVYTSIEETQENYVLVNGQYVVEDEALIIKKQEKQEENVAKCNEKRYNQTFTITLQDKECVFDSTAATESDLMKAFMATADGTSTYDNWVCNNYVVINLTHEDVLTVYATLSASIVPLYNKQKEYAEAIVACTTIAEVEAIVIDYDIVEED